MVKSLRFWSSCSRFAGGLKVRQGQFIPHAQQFFPLVVHIVVVYLGRDIFAHGLLASSGQRGLQGRGVVLADVHDLLRGDVGLNAQNLFNHCYLL